LSTNVAVAERKELLAKAVAAQQAEVEAEKVLSSKEAETAAEETANVPATSEADATTAPATIEAGATTAPGTDATTASCDNRGKRDDCSFDWLLRVLLRLLILLLRRLRLRQRKRSLSRRDLFELRSDPRSSKGSLLVRTTQQSSRWTVYEFQESSCGMFESGDVFARRVVVGVLQQVLRLRARRRFLWLQELFRCFGKVAKRLQIRLTTTLGEIFGSAWASS
jgi:hypothetical protein